MSVNPPPLAIGNGISRGGLTQKTGHTTQNVSEHAPTGNWQPAIRNSVGSGEGEGETPGWERGCEIAKFVLKWQI
ncbi:MAG: hypothetical protein KME26_29795 [Oscillatoria princeps RMCB-10]|nr:hypothetical protein [Oscillatoria princeps RMCB-10]